MRSGGLFHLVTAAALIALFLVKSRYEERLLRAAFPGYDRYAESTLVGRLRRRVTEIRRKPT